MTNITHEDLTEWLPHRTPILLPKCISVVEAGRSGMGRVRLDVAARLWDEDTHALYAQVLVLESAAQILGVVLGTKTTDTSKAEGEHLLLGFDDVTFGETLAVTEDFEVSVELERSLGKMHRAHFLATQSGRAIATGRLSVMKG